MSTYQERFVAFIDILGFKDLVERSENEPHLLERLVAILDEVNDYSSLQRSMDSTPNDKGKYFNGMFRISTFSDSILISTKSDPLGLMLLLMIVTTMCNKLLHQGVLTRGAVSKGKMIHTERIAIGDGLIKAYQLESSTAIYPRILIDDSILSDGRIKQKELRKRLRQDFDGLWHLHIFEENVMKLNSLSTASKNSVLANAFMEAGRKEIEHSIKNSKNLSVKAKAIWLARYFNEHANNFKLELISVE